MDSGVAIRRSFDGDVAALKNLLSGEEYLYAQRFVDYNFHTLIEKSFLCTTAVDANDNVVGFAAFNDCPSTQPTIPSRGWESWLRAGWLAEESSADIQPCNSLWMTFFAADEANQYDVLTQILATVFTTSPQTNIVLMALHSDVPQFSPLEMFFDTIPLSGHDVDEEEAEFHKCTFEGSVLRCDRSKLVPTIHLRRGVVEDYDDLMPLLVGTTDGVVTPLPDQLYLEESLQEQDDYHAVVVATDPHTDKIVGFMAVSAEYEDQQYTVKQYATEPYNRLKPMLNASHPRVGTQPGHNMFQITLFYMNPAFSNRSQQFLPFIFELFPFAEYCTIQLPHAATEHALLSNFNYVPIKKFQPSNLQGERLPLPQGVWLCSRYTLEDVAVQTVAPPHEPQLQKLLSTQNELSKDSSESLCLAAAQCIPFQKEDRPTSAYSMLWGTQVVGVCVVRSVQMAEMYSLRENFELSSAINFFPNGDADYTETDISVNPAEAERTHYRNDMPGIVVKGFYIKPIFRCRIRFFLREVLRHTRAQVVVHLAGPRTETFTPLLHELMLAQPRRVIDQPSTATEDVDNLVCLHFTSHKTLSDEKTKIHARIVVVGSGTTGLAFLYHLIRVPYLTFTNLVLVSQDGLPDHPLHRGDNWMVDTMDWMEREYLFLQIGKKIKVLEGTMIDFDRTDKYIFSDNGCCEPYDHLVLTVGRQYTIPKEIISQYGTKNGVFQLSNASNIRKINQHIHESEIYEDDLSNAVIYGANLDMFAVANCITRLGLDTKRVVLVCPEHGTGDGGKSLFGDTAVDASVDQHLDKLGMTMHKGYVLERLEYDEDNNLTSVVIVPRSDDPTLARGKPIDIAATMFIYAHEKDIDAQVLSALNKRSIVFDGRVIIENTFRTTDKNIYAAGPVAMFSRRFGPSDEFERFSALEVGESLANTVLGFLGVDEFFVEDADDDKDMGPRDDPLAAELGSTNPTADDVARRRPRPLPQFASNICRRVTLPGDFSFFQCSTVNFDKVSDQCQHLSSADPDRTSYIRLSISPNKYIECVTYLGSKPVEIYNLKSLVGLPESCLNIVYNYKLSAQDSPLGAPRLDILDFLRSRWAHAVFVDKFRGLFVDIKNKLREHPDALQVKAEIMSKLRKDGTEVIADELREKYHKRLASENSDARHVVEFELIKFLHCNKAFVPQIYFLPDVREHMQTE